MILTQGQMNIDKVNLYYNYAVVGPCTNEAEQNVLRAMANLSGHNGAYRGYGSVSSGYMFYLAAPFADAIHTAVAPILAKITPDMSDRQIIELCIQGVVDRIDYEVNGGASWLNDKPTGDCESYARMLAQLLSMADIPSIHVTGTVTGGGHGWLQTYIPDEGRWVITDGTVTEVRGEKILSYAEHENMFGYSHSLNDQDCDKVSRALIECAY